MKCDKCGDCCHIPIIQVSLKEVKTGKVPKWAVKLCSYKLKYVMRRKNGRCIALNDENLCSIYKNRPATCRNFEPGCSGCTQGRTWS